MDSIGSTRPEYSSDKAPYDITEKDSHDGKSKLSGAEGDVLAGEMYDERYGGTQRGLKSRHAQMIALGG